MILLSINLMACPSEFYLAHHKVYSNILVLEEVHLRGSVGDKFSLFAVSYLLSGFFLLENVEGLDEFIDRPLE